VWFAHQRVLVATGKSTTLKSKHLTGNAVDFACFDEAGKITWEAKYYKAVANHIKKIAAKHAVKLVWGGDWKSFVDMPHIQLDV
jgi:peptidoglycan LD-endopeptidase CwlK